VTLPTILPFLLALAPAPAAGTADVVGPAARGGLVPPRLAPPREVVLSPADTLEAFRDPAARKLIERARRARERVDSTLRSQEVTFRERLYVGLDADRFRRERALFGQQRAARVRWSRDGPRVVRWLGARQQSPVPRSTSFFGNLDDTFEFLDPGEDRLFLGEDWAVHPLADSADRHYRFRSGDTLRIGLPDLGRTVEMAEVVVEPREASEDLVAASLWFDTETGGLVRAVYRPARELVAEEAPAFVRPALQVEFVTVEYGLERLRWWRPRRIAFEGTGRVSRLLRLPARLEWTFEDYVLNRPSDLDPGEELPEGWRRVVRATSPEGTDSARAAPSGAAGDERADPAAPADTTVTVIPPRDSLLASPELPAPFGTGDRPFDATDARGLVDRLDRIDAPARGLPGLSRSLGPGSVLARYNRVEALALGMGVDLPVTARTELRTRGRVATASGEPDARIEVVRETTGGSWSLAAYRGLTAAGDRGAPLGLGNSLNALLLGQDDGLYYRRLGGAIAGTRRGNRTRLSGRLFLERHRHAAPETDASLPGAFGDDELEGELVAERGVAVGLAGRLRVQGGVDPSAPALVGELRAEAATGDFDYTRLSGAALFASPTGRRWVGGVELKLGTSTGAPPSQRRFFLGGPYTLRGFAPGSLRGESVWTARFEAGRTLPVPGLASARRLERSGGAPRGVDGGMRLLRLVGFADVGWAGPRGEFGRRDPAASVGAGLSVLDGLVRVDVARGVEEGDDWRLHVYSDGLF